MKNNSSLKSGAFTNHDSSFNQSADNNGDQNVSSLKPSSSGEKKCHVYVHHFNKYPKAFNNYIPQNWAHGNPTHQNAAYKHEHGSDYPDPRIKSLRKQFDNLSLSTNQTTTTSANPYKFSIPINKTRSPNKPAKLPYAKSNPTHKMNKMYFFKPEHKAAIDKLEETYWSKWKPNKIFSKEPNPKVKGLYTENDQPKSYHYPNKTQRKERGDSNQAIILNEASEDEEREEEIIGVSKENSEAHELQEVQVPDAESSEHPMKNPFEKDAENEDTNNMQISTIQPTDLIEEEITTIIKLPSDCQSSSDIDVSLKHTDSFVILSAKKLTEEKEHFQQPRCIKLFKNVGYSSSTPINYIKGGSYPLKSCLKKEGSFPTKSSYLSPPSGAGLKMITTTHNKSSKHFRYPK